MESQAHEIFETTTPEKDAEFVKGSKAEAVTTKDFESEATPAEAPKDMLDFAEEKKQIDDILKKMETMGDNAQPDMDRLIPKAEGEEERELERKQYLKPDQELLSSFTDKSAEPKEGNEFAPLSEADKNAAAFDAGEGIVSPFAEELEKEQKGGWFSLFKRRGK